MSKITLQSHQGDIYDNVLVLSPDNIPMFRTSQKRAKWYLDRDLAQIVGLTPSLRIKLSFQPNGPGHIDEPYFLQDRLNICCVCGTEEKLSRHHVLPYCYRRFFALERKMNYHDILPLCEQHHQDYEFVHADKLKQRLARQYNAPVSGLIVNTEHYEYQLAGRYASKMATTIRKHGHKIPTERHQFIIQIISDFIGHKASKEDIYDLWWRRKEFNEWELKPHGQIVMSNVMSSTDGFERFTRLWRKHFVRTMKPEFLPAGWSINFAMLCAP